MRISPAWQHRPKDGRQTLVYHVWDRGACALVWITVCCQWLQDTASLNDLKSLALSEYRNTQ